MLSLSWFPTHDPAGVRSQILCTQESYLSSEEEGWICVGQAGSWELVVSGGPSFPICAVGLASPEDYLQYLPGEPAMTSFN